MKNPPPTPATVATEPPVSREKSSSAIGGDNNSVTINDMATVTDVTALDKDAAIVQGDLFSSAARGNLKRIKFLYKNDNTILFHRDNNVSLKLTEMR